MENFPLLELPKDLISLLLHNYFHPLTAVRCLRVCKKLNELADKSKIIFNKRLYYILLDWDDIEIISRVYGEEEEKRAERKEKMKEEEPIRGEDFSYDETIIQCEKYGKCTHWCTLYGNFLIFETENVAQLDNLRNFLPTLDIRKIDISVEEYIREGKEKYPTFYDRKKYLRKNLEKSCDLVFEKEKGKEGKGKEEKIKEKGEQEDLLISKDNITGLFKIRYKGIEYIEVESNDTYISFASKESGTLIINCIFKKGKEICEIGGYIDKIGDGKVDAEDEFIEYFEWRSLTRKERNNYLLFSSSDGDKTIFHGVCPRNKLSIKKMLKRLKIGRKNIEEKEEKNTEEMKKNIEKINRIYDNETIHIEKYSITLVPMYP